MAQRAAASAATDEEDGPDRESGGGAADRLRSLVDRIERLEEERKALANDIKDIYGEAKSFPIGCPGGSSS